MTIYSHSIYSHTNYNIKNIYKYIIYYNTFNKYIFILINYVIILIYYNILIYTFFSI